MTGNSFASLALALVVLSAGWTNDAAAWEEYSVSGDAGNCAECHGNFGDGPYTSAIDGMSWGDDLHDVHRRDMLNSDCNTCHTSGGFSTVSLASSNGGNGLDAISCMGCHGRAEDNVAGNPGTPAITGYGAGLRQHHQSAGVTMCAGCHADADPTAYTPVGEHVLPPYYATPGAMHPAMPVDPCNPVASEDFAAGSLGLDNDGDDLFDGADPDCMMAMDAGTDAGSDAGMDAGTDASVDGGTDGGTDASTDAGTDAGTDASTDGGIDAGSDSGTPPVDSGTPPADSGTAPDSGVGTDSGTPPTTDDGGCGCSVPAEGSGSGGATFGLVLGVLLFLRRRRWPL